MGMDQGVPRVPPASPAPTGLAGALAPVAPQLSQLECLEQNTEPGTAAGIRMDGWWSPGEGPVGMGGLLGKVMIP